MKFRIVYILVLMLVAGNLQAKKLSKTNLAEMYSEYGFTRIEARIFHVSEQLSTVYLNLRLHDFEYKENNNGKNISTFEVAYELFESYDSKSPVDSASFIFSDSLYFGEEMNMIVDFDVPAIYPGNYVLKISITDLNRNDQSVFTIENIYKSDKLSSQNYLLTDANNFPLFGNYIANDASVKIHASDTSVSQLSIRYYSQSFPLAKPVFTAEKSRVYKFDPDSVYSISLQSGISEPIRLPFNGIYHFQSDVSLPEGLTLYKFDDGFPEVSSPASAIAPLRYLTTENEFKKLLEYKNYKIAVDSFWLERSSQQPQRARNMIQRYYSRVQLVNHLFSSFREGWKTDRGLIYIIYGPPSEVYRNDGEEEWVYGERGNPLSIKFYFDEIKNPFTDKELEVERSGIYKTSWMIAIENWRR